MNSTNEEGTWGVHLIDKLYSSSYPQPPKWVTGRNEERWSKLGVVIWDAQLHLVTHLRGNEALDHLSHLRQTNTWKQEGLLVGETIYTITIPNDTKSKKGKQDQEGKSETKGGWRLTNTIQLSPDQTKQFFLFLEEKEEKLHNIVDEEESEKRKILGKVYSLILSWRKERLKNNPTDNTTTNPQTTSQEDVSA